MPDPRHEQTASQDTAAPIHGSDRVHSPGLDSDRELAEQLSSVVVAQGCQPDATVVIPVNAQADIRTVRGILSDLGRYQGRHALELLLVVNNFPTSLRPNDAIADLERLGVRVHAVPDVRVPGEPPGFTARMVGIQLSRAPYAIAFDADNRIPDPTALVDFYVDEFRAGAAAVYSHVGYHEYVNRPSIRLRIAMHHASRWVKRVILRVPTTRGGNYGVDVAVLSRLYGDGLLADEMNVGPAVKRDGGHIAYSSHRSHVVLTSGRVFKPGFVRLGRYLARRVVYNLRVIPARRNVHERTLNVQRSYPARPDPSPDAGDGPDSRQ